MENKMSKFVALEIAKTSAAGIYHMMTAMIVPRPIALVTTINEDSVVNAAPFSFFNGVCADPPLLMFCVARRKGMLKDTSRNLRFLGEFVVNICSQTQSAEVEKCGEELGVDESEVDYSGLSLIESLHVRPPRIADTDIQMECRLESINEVGNGPTDMVIGRILEAHANQNLLDAKGRINVARLNPLARLSGGSYAGITDPFKP
jgi:flavin reductase (DIM6/NTAB) family NADH-FMN oxidoreductase RutF